MPSKNKRAASRQAKLSQRRRRRGGRRQRAAGQSGAGAAAADRRDRPAKRNSRDRDGANPDAGGGRSVGPDFTAAAPKRSGGSKRAHQGGAEQSGHIRTAPDVRLPGIGTEENRRDNGGNGRRAGRSYGGIGIGVISDTQ